MSSASATQKAFPFYPFLLAIYPTARLYGDNAGLLTPRYVLLPSLLSLFGTAIAAAFFFLIYRDRDRSAAATAATLLLFFSYGLVHRALTLFSLDHHGFLVSLTHHRSLLLLWASMEVLALWGVGKWVHDRSPQLANFASCALLTLAIGRAAVTRTSAEAEPASTSIQGPRAVPSERPDVYYVILDGYGRRDVLQRFFRYDNKPFLDELRRRGFWIGERSHSNYLETGYSIPSSLNADFLFNLTDTKGGKETESVLSDSRVFFRLMDHSRVASEFRQLGYQIVNVGSGFSLTNYNQGADLNYGSSLNLTEFNSMLLSTTLLLPFVPSETQMITGEDLLRNLGNLAASARLRSPKFVFAHVLSPHPPYQFDAAGNPAPSPPAGVIMNWENVSGYVGQVRFLNQRILQTIDAILASSQRRPIIILQGDHGPSITDERIDRRWNTTWSPALQFARSGILNAMLVPDQVRKALYPTITPVNTFRTIFREQFRRAFEPLPDKTYLSTVEHPLLFQEVDQRVLNDR